MAGKEMSFINVQLEKDLKDRFEDKIKLEERTLSQAVRLLIKGYLGENENS